MDTSTEKKWFIYLGNHHEGPFSPPEIQNKLDQNQMTLSHHAWSEGMPDWKTLTEIPEFASMTAPRRHEPNRGVQKTPPTIQADMPHDPLDDIQLDHSEEPLKVEGAVDDLAPPENDVPPKKVPKKSRRNLTFPVISLGMALVLGAAFNMGYLDPFLKVSSLLLRPYLLVLADQAPFFEKWISPISFLDDVVPEEYEGLRAAAKDPLPQTPPKLAIALSQRDLSNPKFYLASHLPDGAQFTLHIIGTKDTLLNQLSYYTQLDVTLNQKLALSNPLQLPDGKPIPRGEYGVYVVSSDLQRAEIKSLLSTTPAFPTPTPAELPKDAKVLAFKTYFLGGPRDITYTSRLKSYHDKLREKATDELKEIVQFATTLENQLNSTTTKFSLLHKGRITPKQQQDWERFHNEWTKLEGQLDQIFQNWTTESLQKEYFYDMLYSLTREIGFSVVKVHAIQNTFFSGNKDLKTFEIQLGELLSSTQNEITVLKSKIAQAEKIPPTPNGMPRKEGL